MTKKKINYAWYPSSNFQNYAYTASLQDEESEAGLRAFSEASKLITSAHSSMQAEEFKNRGYINLNALWRHERIAEQTFIQRYLKVQLDYNDKNETQQLLQNINFILNSKSQLEATLKTIKQLELKSEGGYKGYDTAIYAATTYQIPLVIQQIILNYFTNDYDIQADWSTVTTELYNRLEKAVGTVIEDIILTHTENSTGINPYQELYEYLNSIEGHNQFIHDILVAYGVNKDNLLKLNKTEKNKKRNIQDILKGLSFTANKRAGTAAETFFSWFASALSSIKTNNGQFITTIDTANLNMQKADLIMLFGTAEFDTSKLEEVYANTVARVSSAGERSKRLQNMEAIQTMLHNLDDARNSVVEISEKSYKLTGQAFNKNSEKYGGFAAESPNIENLDKILSRTLMSSSQIADLIFLLVNSGNNMINQRNVKDAMDAIALNIASFLFDDVVITDAVNNYHSSANVIHIFNLNGVMIPLSVFLEGVYHAFMNNAEDLADYIVVNFHAQNIIPNSDSNKALEESDWNKFYQDRLSQNSVTIHFFGDFINFIQSNM